MSNEFHLDIFAQFYEHISDTFLDTKGNAESLKRLIPKGARLFELGLGTGYFASFLVADGYEVQGIQPRDEMLPLLIQRHPEIRLAGECGLEEYSFVEKHETVISHSSVFLFTKLTTPLQQTGESLTSYIFQSFINSQAEVVSCLGKTLQALTHDGRLFINIQTNPLPMANLSLAEGELTFEMARCEYSLDLKRVNKTFRFHQAGKSYVVEDSRFCETFSEFVSQVSRFGFEVSVSDDLRWVIIQRPQES